MKSYHTNDVTIDVPPGYVDQTTNILRKEVDGRVLAVVVTRQQLSGVTFADHTRKLFSALADVTKDAYVVHAGARKLSNGTVAEAATIEATANGLPVIQRLLVLPHQELALSIVVCAQRGARSACLEVADGVASTLRQRKE